MRQLLAERTIYAPVLGAGLLNGVGPRVGESGFSPMPGYAYTTLYGDITPRGV
jgi:hypothetical protein